MEVVIYAIPFITALFLLIVFHKKMVWWEYVVLILPSILFVLLTQIIMVEVNSKDTEYLGSCVTKITHYDPWDEMVTVPRTRRVPCGRNSDGTTKYRTETYYVRERRFHSDMWTYVSNLNDKEHIISESEYNLIKNRFGGKEVYRDMHRNYHTIDGDAQDVFWDKSVEKLYDITTPNKYKNRINSSESHTILKMEEITEENAKKIGLYDYPEINNLTHDQIIGKDVPFKDKQRIRYINSTYGKPHQFRLYMLLFEDKDVSISEKQRAYWQNGNKNEFVVCLGLKGDSVVWCNPFSWCDEPILEVLTKDYFINNPKFNADEYGKWLQTQIPTKWKRKEFKDFKYINVGVSGNQYVALLIIMIILNLCISIWLVTNDINNEQKQ